VTTALATLDLAVPPESALGEAFVAALEVDSLADAAQALASLAELHLSAGAAGLAEAQARFALAFMDGLVDLSDEVGNVQLVLGRALMEQECYEDAAVAFRAAETFQDAASSWNGS